MNAKKIMGAVLVALLAAALFVGAGAAADNVDNLGTVFVYQNTSYTGSWNGEAGTVEFLNGVIESLPAPGYYTNGSAKIYVTYPTAAISVVANVSGETYYNAVGSTLYLVDGLNVTFSVQSPAEVAVYDLLITYPNGVKNTASAVLGNTVWMGLIGGSQDYLTGNVTLMVDKANLTNLTQGQTGDFKIQALFAKVGQQSPLGNYPIIPTSSESGQLIAATPDSLLVGTGVYTITVADASDVTISASTDSVIEKNAFSVTITGQPGEEYKLVIPAGFDIKSAGAATIDKSNGEFTMPNDGKITVFLIAGEDGEYTLDVTGGAETVSVDIEVIEGAITAATDKEAYYIGNDVKITGTSNAESTVYAYIAGTNLKFTELLDDTTYKAGVKNGEFEYKFGGNNFKNYDAGTYTVYISTNDSANNVDDLDVYTTAALVLKQPFISVTDAPSVAVKGATYKVTGTAEATDNVYVYIFGTNFFAASNKDAAKGDLGTTKFVTVKDKNSFTVEFKVPSDIAEMAAGQYFMVVQHPMFDGNFNIAPFNTTSGAPYITVNTTGPAKPNDEVVVDVADRQKANAAQALCDNLDTQNVDDMYVKLSFVVAAAQSVINPIPETVAQGEKLTVSGSTNVGKGQIVTVDMLSTAFAAVPKETVGSASFISLTTKTDENGNWEVTFDTSGLNVDEYTVSAAVEQLGTATAKVNVVEAAPEQPDQPDVPGDEPGDEPSDEPVAPETPGFGALAALAGLGAVAVLLLRRE